MKIKRIIKNKLIEYIKPWKVLVLYWPRQVWKTTLVNEILSEEFPENKILSISWDNKDLQKTLSSQSKMILWNMIKWYDILFIDEAQKIENIWLNLKIIVDSFPQIKIIATWSSSFHLKNVFWEPLVGRKHTFKLFPI